MDPNDALGVLLIAVFALILLGGLLRIWLAPYWRLIRQYGSTVIFIVLFCLFQLWCWPANARHSQKMREFLDAQEAECRRMGGFPIWNSPFTRERLERCER